MTTDHNEAMNQLPHKLATLIQCLPQAPFREHLAAECIKQAERIAELELQPAFAQLASDLAAKLADTEAERDTLRADVERLNLAEEGAAQAFGDVVQQKRDLEAEVKRLQSLLDGAYASIREYADTARKATQ